MSLPWLLPNHSQPWTSFHTDAAMALAALPLAAWAFWALPGRVAIPMASLAAALLALVPVAQAAMGTIRYGGDGWIAALYLLGFAMAVIVGSQIEAMRPGALTPALFLSFGTAALLSMGLALYQWLGLTWLGVFAVPLVGGGGRAMANLAQPNHLATLLVWGLIAIWYAHLRHQARGWVCALAAAVLLLGVAMTQSRTGGLEVLLLGMVSLYRRDALQSRRNAIVLVALGVWFVIAFVGWAPLNRALGETGVAAIEERLAPGTRLLHWHLLLDAAMQRPWTGWGWNQIVQAQVALASAYPPSHEVVQYGHNLLLDLLLWNGLPLALLVALALVAWLVYQVRHAHSVQRVLLLAAVAVFLLHAQLELPHGYLLFLLPVGLMVGMLGQPMAGGGGVAAPRFLLRLALAGLALSLALVLVDYARMEEAWQAQRMRDARVGSLDAAPVPQAVLLSQLQALLESARIVVRADMPRHEVEQLRDIAQRQPSAQALLRFARATALNGDPVQARRTLDTLCRLYPPRQCASIKAAWIELAENDPAIVLQAWPPEY
jgi:O-antigen ligase